MNEIHFFRQWLRIRPTSLEMGNTISSRQETLDTYLDELKTLQNVFYFA